MPLRKIRRSRCAVHITPGEPIKPRLLPRNNQPFCCRVVPRPQTTEIDAACQVCPIELHCIHAWLQYSNRSLMGRFYRTSGTPIDAPSVMFGPVGSTTPVGGVGFGGNLSLVVATRVDTNFSNGDVYGRFIQPLTDVPQPPSGIPAESALYAKYPNPFNPSTTIRFAVGKINHTSVPVFDMLGREVATLVNEVKQPGAGDEEVGAVECDGRKR